MLNSAAFPGHAGRAEPLRADGRLRALAPLAVSATERLIAGASFAAAGAPSLAATPTAGHPGYSEPARALVSSVRPRTPSLP